jgi:hypothetical protein
LRESTLYGRKLYDDGETYAEGIVKVNLNLPGTISARKIIEVRPGE